VTIKKKGKKMGKSLTRWSSKEDYPWGEEKVRGAVRKTTKEGRSSAERTTLPKVQRITEEGKVKKQKALPSSDEKE